MAAHGTWGRSSATGQDDKGRRSWREVVHVVRRLAATLSLVLPDAERSAEPSAGEAHVRWQLAAAAGGFGLFDWNIDTDQMSLDAQAATLCGFHTGADGIVVSRAELRSLVHDEDQARVQAALENAVADGRRFAARYRVRGRDGTLRHLQAMGVLDRRDGPVSPRVVGVVRDVSGEELQLQLAMQRDSAQQLAKAPMDFLSRISHELRTPLNAVIGFAELMSLDASNPLAPSQAQRLQHIVDAGTQLRDLVDDMLDLSRIDAGGISVSVRLIDAAAVLRASIAVVDAIARQHGVQVVNHLGETPLRVYADSQRLQQVFVNLLTNGCKYNRRGGELVVSSEWSARGLVMRFADTGMGIAPKDLAELGRPFNRVGAQSGQVEGSGLGLYIVKLILDRMRAALEVKSEPGLGSCFSVILPIKPPVG
jgi:signal transduction histidine kinase